jgi:hypothetical protein
MWIVAIVLTGVIMIHVMPTSSPPLHHQMRVMH